MGIGQRGPTGSLGNARGRAKTASGTPALTPFLPFTRARALMARQWSARSYGVARQPEGSRQNSIGGSGVLSLRHFGPVLFIPWRVGAEETGAAKDGFGGAMRLGPPGRCSGCWPHDGE